MSEELRVRVLLSFQRALLGNVSPSLRGVTVTWTPSVVNAVAYFDGSATEEDLEAISVAEAEVLADFGPEFQVRIEVVRLDAPERLPSLKEWVYLRLEEEG